MVIDINQMKKVFIAGSNGMVGNAIYRSFIKNKKKFQEDIKFLLPNRSDLDLTNFKQVDYWFANNQPDIVIISAAKVGGIYANDNFPYDFILENLKIQTNLLEISYKHNVKKLLFLGSSCIYPKFANQPIKEESLLTGMLEKTNEFYAISKIAGIKLCQSLRIQHGFNAICLMPTNLYGPGDNYHSLNSHVLPSLIRRFHLAKVKNSKTVTCWGSGNVLREFLYVDDLADACIFLLNNWDPSDPNSPKDISGNPLYWINVGSNYEISIKELAEKISKIVGFTGEILWDTNKPDGTPRKKLDTEKLNNFGWQAKTNLDEGIRLTFENYLESIQNNNLRCDSDH